MEPKVFEKLCSIAHREAGIKLTTGKEALVAARVAKRLRALDLSSERAYLKHLQDDTSGEELTRFLDVISTNYTSFMREPDHFKALSEWARSDDVRRRRRLRLWCAAAASGEEPYSIAITLLEAFDDQNRDLRILATDISTRALEAAMAGCYEDKTVSPLSRSQRSKYFTRDGNRFGRKNFEVRPEVKKLVSFCRLNLAAPPFPMKGPLDIVFCRNVMIYFDHDVRASLTTEIERLLAPGGILFTSHSETLAGIRTGLRVVKPSVYRKPAIAGLRMEP